MNYLLAVWSVITTLIATVTVIFAVLLRRAHKKLYKAWIADMSNKNDEIHKLVVDIEMYRATISAGETERIQNQAAIADLYEALTECQDKYKALERQTVQVETPVPARPTTKRNNKGQFAKKAAS